MTRVLGFFALAALVMGCSASSPAKENATETAVLEQPSEEPEADAASPPSTSDAGATPRDAATLPACEATSPRAIAPIIHVFPDDGEAPYVDAIAAAQQELRVFGYMMGFGGVLDALVAKAKAGLDVRVILDGETQRDVNEKYRTQLEAAGAKVEWSDPQFSYMHAKTIISDNTRALVSTGNYSRSFMLKERNYAATLVDAEDIEDLVALFEADWSHTSPDLTCTRLLVSPVNARGRLEALIASAQKELLVESMQLGDKSIRAAIAARAKAGVAVRVVLAAPSWISANESAATFLAAQSIPARALTSPSVHVKAIIVDGERAYLGSENLSTTSLDKNREIGVVVVDSGEVSKMTATFERDYAAAAPL